MYIISTTKLSRIYCEKTQISRHQLIGSASARTRPYEHTIKSLNTTFGDRNVNLLGLSNDTGADSLTINLVEGQMDSESMESSCYKNSDSAV